MRWPFVLRHDRAAGWFQSDTAPGSTFWANTAQVANTRPTQDTAVGLSAVWRAISLICDTVSMLPIAVYREGSRRPVEPLPRVLTQPAADFEYDEWVWAVMFEALTSPAAYCLITDRVGPGMRPAQLEPLGRTRITVEEPRGGPTVYRLDGAEVDRDQLWRLRLYPRAEQVGLDVIRIAAECIGQGLAAQNYGRRFFADAAIPTTVLLADPGTQEDDITRAKGVWEATHGGRRGTAILAGLKPHNMSITPEAAQALESRQFNVQEVARFFGLPPESIGTDAGASRTYANLEQRSLDLLVYGLDPKITRLENRLNPLLPRGHYCKINRGALLRTDLKTRYESYQIGLAAGFLTVDEVRELEDREPLPAGAPTLGVVA
jgi:HK97 family phage portal protein